MHIKQFMVFAGGHLPIIQYHFVVHLGQFQNRRLYGEGILSDLSLPVCRQTSEASRWVACKKAEATSSLYMVTGLLRRPPALIQHAPRPSADRQAMKWFLSTQRQCKIKSTSHAALTFGPNFTIMAMDDLRAEV